MDAVARWRIAVAGSGAAAVGVSVALWWVPAPADGWMFAALVALRLLAVLVVGGFAAISVLVRRLAVEEARLRVGPAVALPEKILVGSVR